MLTDNWCVAAFQAAGSKSELVRSNVYPNIRPGWTSRPHGRSLLVMRSSRLRHVCEYGIQTH